MSQAETVQVGVPISTEQAIGALLGMISSPMVGDLKKDGRPSRSLARIKEHAYPFLSGGEKKLVDVAQSVWEGPVPAGAHISALGGLDRDNRRKVLLVLVYFYLGRDVRVSLGHEEFVDLFGEDVLFFQKVARENERLRGALEFAARRAKEGIAKGDDKGAISWRLGLVSVQEHAEACLAAGADRG